MTRARSVALAAAAAAALAGCADGLDGPATLPELDRPFLRCYVQPVMAARCAFAGCHGSARRPLRVYAVARLRLGIPWSRLKEPLTDGELEANYQAARGFADDRDGLPLLLAKPLDTRAGGRYHRGQDLFGEEDVFVDTSDRGYRLIEEWLGGATAPAGCEPTVEVGP